MAKKIESGSVSLTLHSVVQNPLALLLTQSIPVDQSDTMTENQTKAVTIKANRSLSDLDMSELEQLFTWARESTANCPGAVVQNLSTSFRSGLAFCAIVERHRPRLLDYGAAAELAATGPSGWLQCHLMAAEAARRLGVTRLPDPAELISRRTPDVPTVLDFLQQLRRCLALSSPHCDQIDHHQTDMQDVEIVDIVDHSPDAAMQLLIRRQQELVDERCCLNRLCADLSDCLSRSATPGSGAVAAGVRGLLADWYSLLMRRLLLHNRWQQLELMQRELQQLNRLESLKRRIRRHLQAEGQCQSLDPKLSRELARELKRRDRLLAQLDRLEIRSATEQQMATRAICQAAAADAVDDASKGSWQACSLL
uniref:Calponin-homology (CH) domain-containing protein n=1 Tax=Macrostomum lignano TaxID=282301 RepID=A0A1I8G8P8_9PLAT